jgi:hypothetical protein
MSTRRHLSAVRLNLAVWLTSAGRLVDDLAWGLSRGTLVAVVVVGLVAAVARGWAV